jgi:hypothetical protein
MDDEDGDDEDDDGSGEDKDASFSEDEFTKMMQEMMGMPPEVMKEIMRGKLGPGAEDPANRANLRQPEPAAGTGHVENLEMSADDADDADHYDDDMQNFMKQMEAELRGSGALDLGSGSGKPLTKEQAKRIKESKQKSDVDMDEEDELGSDDDDDDDDDEIDDEININLAKNLLESLKSQAGTSGPGGNLMSMMGFQMPRDEPDDDEDVAGPSGTSSGGGKGAKGTSRS